ncbi:MAG: DUF72 domain-containing protein [Deferribacteraceae bacterium]|jgi:uncharacterized protein YecE (DUF72 family)|nr:DUF72 domain-containing protein [Deferribacteraceae bacterium]
MKINDTPLYIGTSGYNHEDWKGVFAPQDMHNYDLLTYYADQGINFLEVAFTFYRIPEADKIQHIINRTGDRVRFSVRMPKALVRNPWDDTAYEEFIKGVAPMLSRGLLECFYADYHPSFSASKKNQEMIAALRNRFPKIRFFAELSNRTWYKERIFSYFREHDVGMTVIDMPNIKGSAPYYPVSLNHALYFKFYGHNPLWITTGEKFLNYSYSDNEIRRFLRNSVECSVTAQAVYFIFANVAAGCAPKNVLRAKELAKKYE